MFTLPDLPYAYNALEPYIDEETMHLHHDKHHATYVKNLNDALSGHDDWLSMDIDDVMKKLNDVPQEIRTKVRNNGGGHANHTFFWQVMGAPLAKGKGGEPSGELLERIEKGFGGFSQFQAAFEKSALGRFGSGWVWLVSSSGKLTLTDTPNQDNPWMDDQTPILGLDVWEHAYYLKYKNMRADYVKAWWNVVNWEEVGRRFAKVS